MPAAARGARDRKETDAWLSASSCTAHCVGEEELQQFLHCSLAPAAVASVTAGSWL